MKATSGVRAMKSSNGLSSGLQWSERITSLWPMQFTCSSPLGIWSNPRHYRTAFEKPDGKKNRKTQLEEEVEEEGEEEVDEIPLSVLQEQLQFPRITIAAWLFFRGWQFGDERASYRTVDSWRVLSWKMRRMWAKTPMRTPKWSNQFARVQRQKVNTNWRTASILWGLHLDQGSCCFTISHLDNAIPLNVQRRPCSINEFFAVL